MGQANRLPRPIVQKIRKTELEFSRLRAAIPACVVQRARAC